MPVILIEEPPTAPPAVGFLVPRGGSIPLGAVTDSRLAGAALGTLGLFGWVVPGLVLSVPGMLVLLIIGMQALGGLAWLPVARRRIGAFGIRWGNRRRRQGRS